MDTLNCSVFFEEPQDIRVTNRVLPVLHLNVFEDLARQWFIERNGAG
ncbi:MAG: hypothetical protein HKN13_14445 [Rhodothermales bacterium]|nr:hypothetical protein [Rhodothermales bacterium]